MSQGLSIVKASDQYSNIYKKWVGALEPQGFSLRTVLKYIGGIILPGVHMETRLEKDTLNILGSSTHLSKTVMNLVSNAAEAMPGGGR